MDNLYIIKSRLNEALSARGMTAAELSRLSGINKSSLSRYLSGESIPRSLAIGKMATALRVNPAWVLGYSVPMEMGEPDQPDPIDLSKLSDRNYQLLLAYYRALIDAQGGSHGNS